MAESFQDLRFCTVYHASKMLDQQPAPGEFKSGNEKQLIGPESAPERWAHYFVWHHSVSGCGKGDKLNCKVIIDC